MSGSNTKRVGLWLVFALALMPSVVPTMAGNAAGRDSALPYTRLYRTLGVKPGVYYLVSPEIISMGPFDVNGIDIRLKQLKLGTGYVMVYGEHEKLAGRAALARENMITIRRHLDAASLVMPKGVTAEHRGVPDMDALFSAANYTCHMKFLDKPHSQLTLATAGVKLSDVQFCVGFGIAAALAGYRIQAGGQGLEFRRVIDVKQGSAMQDGRAESTASP